MSKSKLALQIIIAIVIAACGYAGGVFATRHPVENNNEKKIGPRPEVWNHLPQVDGEIIDCLPSPDYSRIAVLYSRQTPLCPIRTIAIFDPVRKKLLGKIDLSCGAPLAPWTWSPDSKWLTVPEEEQNLRMISRNGLVKVIPTNTFISDIVWREDQPHKLLYTSSGLYEYDLNTHSKCVIKTKSSAMRLFSVSGKPYATCAVRTASGGIKSVEIILVDTEESVLRITAPDNGEYSTIHSVELSPDGKYASLVCTYKSRCLGIIAKSSNVERVLSDRSKALFVTELPNPILQITWPTEDAVTSAIVNGRIVDLQDGCLRYSPPNVKWLASWKSVTRDGKQVPSWLDVGKFGLCITTGDHQTELTPILSHTVSEVSL